MALNTTIERGEGRFTVAVPATPHSRATTWCAHGRRELHRVTDEDRQVHFVSVSHLGRRLKTDLHLEDVYFKWTRMALDAELHGG
jgi:hypothetical protein